MIISEIKDQVGYISLDNSSRLNALSSQMDDELIACLNEYETKKIRAVVLKATPNKNNVWSAGHDINELPVGKRDPLGYFDHLEELLHAIQTFPAPVIAQVHGSVWGGACDLVMCCDIVVADTTATFAMTPAKLGLPYNASGIMHFLNRMHLNHVREMFFTAQPIAAETAKDWGIVNHLAPEGELEANVEEIVSAIHNNSPMAIAVIKEQIRLLGDARPLSPDNFERVQGLRRKVYDSYDYAEGIQSFKEKRKPQYRGE
jgi:methylmalonyl-CoA decarboxylase